MSWVKIYNEHLTSYADSIRYAKDGTEYTTTLERARAEIAQDNGYFEDIESAVQDKTGTTEPIPKNELASAINGIVVDPNANLEAYIQGDLTNIVFNGTSIAQYKFRNGSITSIEMPNVINISTGAFFDCSQLELNELPTGLITMGTSAFRGALKINISVIPNGVNIIQGNAFQNCIGILNLKFLNGLTSIGSNAFNGCTGLLTIDLSASLGVINIQSTSFANTTCTFLFRDQAQLDEYASATNWSALADRFHIKGGAS